MSARRSPRFQDLPEVLTVRQVARLCGVAENTIYAHLRRPDGMPFVRCGRRVLISKDALQQWLAGEVRRSAADMGLVE